jgi:TRAP-type transport system periplasmic protein
VHGVWALVVGALLATTAARADEQVLKIATLAPEGTAWMRLGHEWAEAIGAHSGGRLRVKIISGGAAGDERTAVHKIRGGQLAGAAVTTVGLGVILGDVLVLQEPMFLRSYEELDFVRTQLAAEIRGKFLEHGFVLLAWADVGEVRIFSKFPIRTRADLAHARVWTWVDDPVGRKLLQELGVQAVPLGVPDVAPSLASGLIDVCYGSPLVALALQWHPHVRYMTSQTILQAVGAIVVARRELEALPADLQQIVLADSKALEDKMIPMIRDDNARALAALKRNGLRVVEPSPELIQEFQAASDRIRDPLDSSIIGHDFRLRVEKLLVEFRARKRAR